MKTGTRSTVAIRNRTYAGFLIAVMIAVSVAVAAGQDDLAVGFGEMSREAFVAHMTTHGEAPETATARWDLAQALIADGSLSGERAIAAFLHTPRHVFARESRPWRAYADTPLDIGYGQTISAPHMVGRMTSQLEVVPGDRVLEVGTGSGYQAAVLSVLTDAVHTIEIIEPLAAETAALFETLIAAGHAPYAEIQQRTGDGYYGWPERAPFDRIIVTAAIDHIPPPLIEQLSEGGRMLIPVGPPTAQILLEVTKTVDADGQIRIDRRDVYGGRARVRFVPLTRADGLPYSR